MDAFPINWWAVIVAAVVKFVIGWAWYMPLFGKQWRALLGVPENASPEGLPTAIIVGAVGDLVMAYILARFVIHYGDPSIGTGLLIGFMAWLGFVATVLIGQVFYERRPFALWLINNSYLLLSLLIMGAILGWWHSGALPPSAA